MTSLQDTLLQYRKNGILPDGIDHQELNKYLLEHAFPRLTVSVLDKGFVLLVNTSHIPIPEYGTDYMIVDAARVSTLGVQAGETHLGDIKRDGKLVTYLRDHRHMSCFEHQHFTFVIKAPLYVIAHFLRHRTSSFNQESARYRESKEEFYVPQVFRKLSSSNRLCSTDVACDNLELLTDIVECFHNTAIETYNKLLAAGVCREQARGILPLDAYSSLYMTSNLRNWLHFLSLRESADAQWETQQYAKAIHDLLKPYIPMSDK